MMLEALAGAILGIGGIIPFVHVNLLLQVFGEFITDPYSKAVFAISIAISHSFFGIMPALIIIAGGTVDLRRKEELERVFSIAAVSLAFSIISLPVFYLLLPIIKLQMRESFRFLFLSLVLPHLLVGGEAKKKILGVGIFLLSGILGSMTFLKSVIAEPLFPMLSGFFAIPALLMNSYGMDSENEESTQTGEGKYIIIIAAVVASAVSTLFPALTVGVLLGILMLIMRDGKKVAWMVPSLLISKVFYDIAAAAITGNTRSYPSVLTLPLVDLFSEGALSVIVSVCIAAGGIALLIIFQLTGRLGGFYARMGEEGWRRGFFIAIIVLIFLAGGATALLLMAVASCIGLMALQLRVKRSYLMGSLLLPALLYHFDLVAEANGLLFG